MLECPVCYRHASAQDRVHTCANGHYCCADCMQRGSACPVCRDSTQVRNLIAEEMLASPTLQTICGSCGQWHRIGDVHHCAVFPRCPLIVLYRCRGQLMLLNRPRLRQARSGECEGIVWGELIKLHG